MDKKQFKSLLAAYIDGELTASQRRLFEQKLESSPDLRQVKDELTRVRDALASLPHKKSSEKIRDAVCRRILALSQQTDERFEPSAFLDELLRTPEQLLAGYADGELADNQRVYVEDHLLQMAPHRETLEQIQEVSGLVANLPKVKAPAGLLESTLAKINGEADALPEDLSSDAADESKRPFSELLSAYLDDEISPRRRKMVERKLRKSPKSQSRLEQLRAAKNELNRLPKVAAPTDIVGNAMDWLRNENASPEAAPIPNRPTRPAGTETLQRQSKRDRANLWRTVGMFAASLTLTWAIVFYGIPEQTEHGGQLATQTTAPQSTDVTPTQDGNSLEDGDVGEPAVADASSSPKPNRPAEDRRVAKSRPAVYLLPLEQLKDIQPGEMVEVLNQKQVKLVCLDVQRVYDQLRVVMMRHNVPVVASDTSDQTPAEPRGHMYVLDISTSPDRLTDVLTDLWESERQEGAMVWSVDIAKPNEDVLENVEKVDEAVVQSDSKSQSEKPRLKVVPEIGAPKRALGNLPSRRVEKALGTKDEKSKTKPSPQPKSANAPEESDAKAKSSPSESKPEKAEPAEKADAAKSESNLRVLFVLEPKN